MSVAVGQDLVERSSPRAGATTADDRGPAARPTIAPRPLPELADVLDALPDAVALLDGEGTIIAVNRAWALFTVDNGGDPASTGVGVNYLEVCERAAAHGAADARAAADGLRAVLEGESMEADLEYACPSPALGRWFMLRMSPIPGEVPGALISHVNITRGKLAELEAMRSATRDPLTGLGNRRALTAALTKALSLREGEGGALPDPDVAVLLCDLDGFKQVNDTHGHQVGDDLLQVVSARIQAGVRPSDTVCRPGGDEFVIVAPRATAIAAAALAERLSALVSEPFVLHGQPISVGMSVGVHMARRGEDPSASLARADAAMYARKRARTADG